MDKAQRRIYAAGWRILDSEQESEAQFRAIDRLACLTDRAVALQIWGMTKPNPETYQAICEAYARFFLSQASPLVSMMPLSSDIPWNRIVQQME